MKILFSGYKVQRFQKCSMRVIPLKLLEKNENTGGEVTIFSQKMAAILNFRIFRKIAKHKNAKTDF